MNRDLDSDSDDDDVDVGRPSTTGNPNRNRDLDSDDEGPTELDSQGYVVPEERIYGVGGGGDGPPPAQEDYDDDEMEEQPQRPPRRQHKYTTANLQPERPWKRWCLICLAFLVTIAIMILIGIFLQRLFDPPEDEDWSSDDPANNTNAYDDDDPLAGGGSASSALLPKSSDYIDSICAEDKLATPNTRQACEQICAPAMECCDPYAANGNSTCFREQVAGCVTYSSCHALEAKNDPAHVELDRICSMGSLEINPEECQLACTSLECCYTDTDSCLATEFQACLDYAPCQNLKLLTAGGSSKYIPTATSELEEECTKDGGGGPKCARLCREATCCSDPNSDCYRDNFIACLTYGVCNQYELQSTTIIAVAGPMYTRVDPAPDNLRNACLQSNVDTAGPAQCQAACSPTSDCCFEDGIDNCFGDDPLGCLEYRGCAVLRPQ